MSNPTTSFYWPKFSKPQLWKMSPKYCLTRTKLASRLMMPIKPFSQSTGLNLIRNKPWSTKSTRSTTIRTTQLRTMTCCVQATTTGIPAKESTTRIQLLRQSIQGAIQQQRLFQEQTNQQLSTKAPTTPETVNSVSTAKF